MLCVIGYLSFCINFYVIYLILNGSWSFLYSLFYCELRKDARNSSPDLWGDTSKTITYINRFGSGGTGGIDDNKAPIPSKCNAEVSDVIYPTT